MKGSTIDINKFLAEGYTLDAKDAKALQDTAQAVDEAVIAALGKHYDDQVISPERVFALGSLACFISAITRLKGCGANAASINALIQTAGSLSEHYAKKFRDLLEKEGVVEKTN